MLGCIYYTTKKKIIRTINKDVIPLALDYVRDPTFMWVT